MVGKATRTESINAQNFDLIKFCTQTGYGTSMKITFTVYHFKNGFVQYYRNLLWRKDQVMMLFKEQMRIQLHFTTLEILRLKKTWHELSFLFLLLLGLCNSKVFAFCPTDKTGWISG